LTRYSLLPMDTSAPPASAACDPASPNAGPSLTQLEQLLAPDQGMLVSFYLDGPDHRLLYASPQAQQVLGYAPADIEQPIRLDERLDTDERIRLGNSLRKAAATAAMCRERVRYQHPRLGLRQLDLRACQAAPGSTTWHAVVFDVTGHSEAVDMAQQLNATLERRVAERTNELQAKTRQLEAFTYSVSHDLKAPLRGIDGYGRLLATQYQDQLDEEGHFFIQNIRNATAQMGQLIEDLLAYSRLERIQIHPVPIALEPLIAKLLAERGELPAGTTLTLQLDCLHTRGEAQALLMALRNLLDNALKFSARQAERHITIGSTEKAGCCRLWVQDDGPGFEMRFHDRIFEIFQRLHRLEDYPGTGVGLAIVRKAMERLGGRAWAHSVPGQGACFYLEMPLQEPVSQAC